jgi:hypothetical protein
LVVGHHPVLSTRDDGNGAITRHAVDDPSVENRDPTTFSLVVTLATVTVADSTRRVGPSSLVEPITYLVGNSTTPFGGGGHAADDGRARAWAPAVVTRL